MRTTITLDDQILAKLKKRAAASGTSVSALITQAVQLLLRHQSPREAATFKLVTFGAGGRFSTCNIDKASSLLERDDVERFSGNRN